MYICIYINYYSLFTMPVTYTKQPDFNLSEHKKLFLEQHTKYASDMTNEELGVNDLNATLEEVFDKTSKLYMQGSLDLLNAYNDNNELVAFIIGFIQDDVFNIRHLNWKDENNIPLDEMFLQLPQIKKITCRTRKSIKKYHEILRNLDFEESDDVVFPDGYSKEIHQGYIRVQN